MDKPGQQSLEKRIAILEACQKRWQECGEAECAAIYQGAAFELKLFAEKYAKLEDCLVSAKSQLQQAHTLLNAREIQFRTPGAVPWVARRDKWNAEFEQKGKL